MDMLCAPLTYLARGGKRLEATFCRPKLLRAMESSTALDYSADISFRGLTSKGRSMMACGQTGLEKQGLRCPLTQVAS